MPAVFVENRAFLKVAGSDATHFLNNLLTADLSLIEPGQAAPSALLTPQGKILFDMLVYPLADDHLLEVAASEMEALLRRLTLYKLRAAVTLTTAQFTGVTVIWDEVPTQAAFQDRRFAAAGETVWRVPGRVNTAEDDARLYTALRIKAGVAEAGLDYPLQDAYPHDVLLDLNGGVSFKKGCYVGQEVVSRMHHRKMARRRIAIVSADTALPATGTELRADGKPLGTLGTVLDNIGLAILRIDRTGDAITNGTPILAGDQAVQLQLPTWTGLDFPAASDED
ncbi:YgfZ/GcvT domain-containing protein [Agrobacterium vitis]|uniref:CAF17-like 4Fe-4S cluster assembly/insertion protein YgfZ n=1 Tax=Agrobacterium vitis TaxID=373 RepID=UPI000871F690|nr:folate-binding protein YgfZ [Agrobacterium vitis]MCE6074521.1 folate-binding protein [Agrobacterium vitis]MCM2470209.1 folate-binding protein YgfZ [Agrobacterium vitis]MUO70845.1 folate-binding protein [Agrobacterium vitis]MUO84586.1 folate-binding protein [Agrobacterium vitis]